jgi:tRNA A37 threonylcarbamoyladenosine synthetase subunit TsaC/SUA5/YrdC
MHQWCRTIAVLMCTHMHALAVLQAVDGTIAATVLTYHAQAVCLAMRNRALTK